MRHALERGVPATHWARRAAPVPWRGGWRARRWAARGYPADVAAQLARVFWSSERPTPYESGDWYEDELADHESAAAGARQHAELHAASERPCAYPPEDRAGAVERLTADHRGHEAARSFHRARALADLALALAELAQEHGEHGDLSAHFAAAAEAAAVSAAWHWGRGRGHADRFADRRQCGTGYGRLDCRACGSEGPMAIDCGVVRVCPKCRDWRHQIRRRRFERARRSLMADLEGAGVFSRWRAREHGGRWTEKDLTLTLPDGHADLVETSERVRVLFAAWPHFRAQWYAYERARSPKRRRAACRACGAGIGQACRRLTDGAPMTRCHRFRPWSESYAAYRRRAPLPVHHRAFEVTPGEDGAGHVHFHVWFVGPYLPVDLARRWWARALVRAGLSDVCEAFIGSCDCGGPHIVNPHVRRVTARWVAHEHIKGRGSIQLVTPGGAHVGYLEGWSVATADKHGRHMSAATEAALYESLERRRLVQASAGFLARGARAATCGECGASRVELDVAAELVRIAALHVEIRTYRSARWSHADAMAVRAEVAARAGALPGPAKGRRTLRAARTA